MKVAIFANIISCTNSNKFTSETQQRIRRNKSNIEELYWHHKIKRKIKREDGRIV